MTITPTTTTLTERYVHATLREVPDSRRADLGDELRSTITDMVEARVDGGQSRDEAERATVAEYYQRVFGQDLPESVVGKA